MSQIFQRLQILQVLMSQSYWDTQTGSLFFSLMSGHLLKKKPPQKGLHVLFNVSCLTFSFSAPTSLCQLNAKLFLSFLACYIEMAIFSQFLLTFV